MKYTSVSVEEVDLCIHKIKIGQCFVTGDDRYNVLMKVAFIFVITPDINKTVESKFSSINSVELFSGKLKHIDPTCLIIPVSGDGDIHFTRGEEKEDE